MKKCFAFGVIFLFLTCGLSPITIADDNTIPQAIGDVPITILEYKADGTVKRTVFRMTHEQADSFHEEMRNAQDLDARLSVYKKYNLIPESVTTDTLQEGMQEKAQRIGLTQEKLESMAKNSGTLFNRHLYVNLFCFVSGIDDVYAMNGYRIIPVGSSLFTLFISLYAGLNIISFDVQDYIIGELDFESKGILGSVDCHFNGLIKIIGFIGYMYIFIDWVGHGIKWRQAFDGFVAYVRATGTFYY